MEKLLIKSNGQWELIKGDVIPFKKPTPSKKVKNTGKSGVPRQYVDDSVDESLLEDNRPENPYHIRFHGWDGEKHNYSIEDSVGRVHLKASAGKDFHSDPNAEMVDIDKKGTITHHMDYGDLWDHDDAQGNLFNHAIDIITNHAKDAPKEQKTKSELIHKPTTKPSQEMLANWASLYQEAKNNPTNKKGPWD